MEGLGYTFPTVRLPLSLIYFIGESCACYIIPTQIEFLMDEVLFSNAAYLTELVHGLVGRYIYNFQPLLTRAEVCKLNSKYFIGCCSYVYSPSIVAPCAIVESGSQY